MRFLEKMFFILICNPVLIKSNEPNIRIRRFDEMFVVNMAKLCIESPMLLSFCQNRGFLGANHAFLGVCLERMAATALLKLTCWSKAVTSETPCSAEQVYMSQLVNNSK